jgi:hypothetical protein
LFIVVVFSFDKLIVLFLVAKLGLFPFFYWMVVVSVKVGFIGNIFVLGFQKIRVFWLFWLLCGKGLVFLYFLSYLSIFFVIVNLLVVRDLWLLIVYSSIANSGIIIISVEGSNYLIVVFLYLSIIMLIIYFIKISDSYIELILVIFFFFVIPPFLLFIMKFYIVLSLESVMKISFFLVIFDVFVLLYYFSLVFIKFLLMELSVFVYIMNLLLLLFILVCRNYVAMTFFN